ncbi:permease-like cell division protein FtsX [Neobittarella massiliensis]|uniref:Cell division protein FtsX n=1 Tax=Neobittarella massiliensis (ex Bilen et al. 2018) TaxID=2041842 RepID=A0A8J6M0S4_9FIRM|nr:permease-like cell division protein FtsX [Neobittarella massiliensis]MBC3514966.1 ABC transporter permease [Neobittarella massiliensis]
MNSSFSYLFKKGCESIWLNKLMSIASVAVLSACLILVGVATLFSANIGKALDYVESQNEVVVFVYDTATDEQKAEIENKVKTHDNIASYTYISKEQALEEARAGFGEDASLLDGIEEGGSGNPLPASYRITLKDLDKMDDTVAQFTVTEGVEKVNSPRAEAEAIVSLKNIVSVAGVTLVVVLVAVSLLIIANTIRLTVFSRRKEINIMKYVGATNGFIRMPFVIEGMLIGLISAVIAYVAIYFGYATIMDGLGQFSSPFITSLADSFIPFKDIWFYVLGGFVGGGMLTGVLGSVVSMRKHLKV